MICVKNAKKVSYKDIMERQGAHILLRPVKLHKKDLAKRREKFFKTFYNYARINNNKTTEKWWVWVTKIKDIK